MGPKTVNIHTICPGCYAQTGNSIVMTVTGELFNCPDNSMHRYKFDENGFLEKTQQSPLPPKFNYTEEKFTEEEDKLHGDIENTCLERGINFDEFMEKARRIKRQ